MIPGSTTLPFMLIVCIESSPIVANNAITCCIAVASPHGVLDVDGQSRVDNEAAGVIAKIFEPPIRISIKPRGSGAHTLPRIGGDTLRQSCHAAVLLHVDA
jgi:hypothetical protein